MVFTIQLAAINYSGPHFPQTQTVTVSKIISGLCPKALLQAARQPPVYLLHSPETPKAQQILPTLTLGTQMGGQGPSLPRAWEGVTLPRAAPSLHDSLQALGQKV